MIVLPLVSPITLPLVSSATSAPLKGGGVPQPYPPPAGYRWEFVTENGNRITDDKKPVVDLVRIV